MLDYSIIDQFERALSEYTGAPFVVLTDCCTHAIELCFRYQQIRHSVSMPKHTYVSALMVLHKLGVPVEFHDHSWQYEYCYKNTNIWDSARGFRRDMYQPGQRQCLSFGHSKRLEIGRGGAILLDNKSDYQALKQMANDGRDLNIKPWQAQQQWRVGYHYNMRLEDAVQGLRMLEFEELKPLESQHCEYPDVSVLKIEV